MRPDTALISTLLLMLFGGIAMAADTGAMKHDFRPGQVWTFHLDASEPAATLTVLKVETLEKLGDVVHISVSAVRVPGGVTRVGRLPMSRAALDTSVLELAQNDSATASPRAGYQ